MQRPAPLRELLGASESADEPRRLFSLDSLQRLDHLHLNEEKKETRMRRLASLDELGIDVNNMRWIDSIDIDSNIHNAYGTAKKYMNGNYVHMPADIAGLSLSLYPHQQRTVAAMIDMENSEKLDSCNGNGISITSSIALLTEPVGSGKTIDILALIISNPRLLNKKQYIQMNDATISSSVTRKFKDVNILHPTIIFVGSGVMTQWKESISKFTKLSYFVVANVMHLKQLFKLIATRGVNKYDIVLVKNGKITNRFDFADYKDEHHYIHGANKVQQPYIYSIINNYKSVAWKRVIIDDFDVVNMPSYCMFMNATFTWLVSSTFKRNTHVGIPRKYYINLSDIKMNIHHYSCYILSINMPLFSRVLCIQNNPALITFLTMPIAWRYVLHNPDDGIIRLMSGLDSGGDDMSITEMINSDSIETAAKYANIISTNIGDIFQKVLGDKYKTYIQAISHIEFIDGQAALWKPIEEPAGGGAYTTADVYKHITIGNGRCNHNDIADILQKARDDIMQIKDETGKAINRVLDRLKDGVCPICYEEFNAACINAFVIYKCCNVILCNNCSDAMFSKPTRGHSCFYCRSNIFIKDIICIPNTLDIDVILKDNISLSDIEEEKEDVAAASKPPNKRTKIDMICDIICGNEIQPDRNINMFQPTFDNIIKGVATDEPIPPVGHRKMLIFSNYNETLYKIRQRIAELPHSVKVLDLNGSSGHIRNVVKEYEQCNDADVALLINSMKNCGGLNLQMTSDVIFTHKIMNRSIETQVIGRAQRIGRTSTLRIHYVQYDNEK